MRTIIIALALAMLAGCASIPYAHPTRSGDQMKRDYSACRFIGNLVARDRNSGIMTRNKAMDECMTNKGYVRTGDPLPAN